MRTGLHFAFSFVVLAELQLSALHRSDMAMLGVSTHTKPEVLAPGIVLLRQAIDLDTQVNALPTMACWMRAWPHARRLLHRKSWRTLLCTWACTEEAGTTLQRTHRQPVTQTKATLVMQLRQLLSTWS